MDIPVVFTVFLFFSFFSQGWFARDLQTLMQAGQVLLQLVPETRNQPTHISIPRDCFETLGLPSDKTYQIMNVSTEKKYGCKLLLCQYIHSCVYIFSGSNGNKMLLIVSNNDIPTILWYFQSVQ